MRYQWLIIASSLVAVMTVYQNCAPARFSTVSDDSSALTESFKMFRPALAVSSVVCLNCHANINGNLITTFDGSDGLPGHLFVNSLPATGHGGDYVYGDYGHGNRFFAGTNAISGTVFVPKVPLTADAQTTTAQILTEGQQTLSSLAAFTTSAPLSSTDPAPNAPAYKAGITFPKTVAQYYDAVMNGRTPEYRKYLLGVPAGMAGIISFPDTPVQEVSSVTIGAPTALEIRTHLTNGAKMTYTPTSNAFPLQGFGLSANGEFYQNDPSQVLACDGDIFVDGPVVLTSLQLQTQNGCRIHATGTVFVQAPAGSGPRAGINFTGGNAPNLQLASSTGISLGMGQCSAAGLATGGDLYANATNFPGNATTPSAGNNTLGGRMQISYGRIDLLRPMFADYAKITDTAGNPQLSDAGDCGGQAAPMRKVTFQHLLLNAPRIDSRYSGSFQGVIITNFYMGSLGDIIYAYDPIFDSVPILPSLNESNIFNVQTCALKTSVNANLTTCN